MTDPRRAVPRTDALLGDARLIEAEQRLGRSRVKQAVRDALAAVRAGSARPDDAVALALRLLPPAATSLHPVLNATGVVLHTNLGRAPLSEAAVAAVQLAAGHVDVEFQLQDGTRARRGRGTLDALRRAVPDAQDVFVVNNGAAALVLATTVLAADREVVISRGEMVEIGDGFRLPELIESTGARLREVGTTNRVTPADYAAAIGEHTGCVLKIHPSNFRIEGFTSSVAVRELARLGVPVVADIGSGLLEPDVQLPDEPDAASALRDGAALVTCSGDKLLGGPQAGLLLGRAELVERLRRHPLARALRVDKLTLAALEATLNGPTPPATVHRRAEPAQLRARCAVLAEKLVDVGAEVVPSSGVVGGGGAPGVSLPGWAVAVPAELALPLRTGHPAVVARVEHARCLIDLRCIDPRDDARLADAVLAAAVR